MLISDYIIVTSLFSQCEVVFDEMEHLSEQYQQLNSAFEAQAMDLSEVQVREITGTLALRLVPCKLSSVGYGHIRLIAFAVYCMKSTV